MIIVRRQYISTLNRIRNLFSFFFYSNNTHGSVAKNQSHWILFFSYPLKKSVMIQRYNRKPPTHRSERYLKNVSSSSSAELKRANRALSVYFSFVFLYTFLCARMWPHWHYRFFLHNLALDSIGTFIFIGWFTNAHISSSGSWVKFSGISRNLKNCKWTNQLTWICTHDEIFDWIGCLSAACVLNISTHSFWGARHKRQQLRFCAIASSPKFLATVFFLFFNELICR